MCRWLVSTPDGCWEEGRDELWSEVEGRTRWRGREM